ncbi:hypothetical protein FSPOR_4167 [Fusarium sporotrichioides]|uniref:NACHT domain-containing protein n=1 Tax=Fusarium sporotrichioides TaxID=5514 RepID=A0A395SDM7_FUSSP|nr:hypothetical protein FSPOR_4167 [Fusarium sporotrichioides]
MMECNSSIIVQSLITSDTSRVQVGNSYNIKHNYHTNTDQEETKKLLEALRSTDPRHDKIEIEQTKNYLLKESYMWILENPEFLAWRDKTHENNLLWIRGDPGKGKTMLLCGIIDEIIPSTRLGNPDSHTSLSYFFCQATKPYLNNTTAVIRGLIYLLVVQQPCLLSYLRANVHWDSRVAVEGLFRNILADPALGEVYLIVDALDECLEGLEFLLAIMSSSMPRIKWLISSRNRRAIEERIEQSSSTLVLSLELNEGSVSKAVRYFIDYRTHGLTKIKRLRSEVAEQVHQHLVQHAAGTFLWVGFVCQRLERCQAWEISKQLSRSPESLTELYKRMMDQIRTSDSYELYIRLLTVVSNAARPLTFSELLAMERLELDEETLCDLIGECGSFLTTRDRTIVFIHESAKNFALKETRLLLLQFGLLHRYYVRRVWFALSWSLLESFISNRPDADPLDSLAYEPVFWADHEREA